MEFPRIYLKKDKLTKFFLQTMRNYLFMEKSTTALLFFIKK